MRKKSMSDLINRSKSTTISRQTPSPYVLHTTAYQHTPICLSLIDLQPYRKNITLKIQ